MTLLLLLLLLLNIILFIYKLLLASTYLGRVSFLCNLQHFCTRTSLKPRFRHVPPRGNTCCCSFSHRLRFFSDSSDFHRICFSSSSRAARNARVGALSSSKSPILSFFRFPLASRRLFLPRAPFGGPVFAKKRNQIPRNCRPPKKTRKLTCQCLVRSWGQRIAAGFGVQNAMVSDGVGAVSVFSGLSTDFD